MKTSPRVVFRLIIPILLFSLPGFAGSTDSTGLPGDHLDLRATLELFKNSKSPEDFEKKLNSKKQHVNNLDINGDGKVDYIRVYDISKNDAHALVLQVPVNEKESQDVAVIEIEKRGDKSAIIQIRGDEAIYGDNYSVEPKPGKEDSVESEKKLRHFSNAQSVVFVNVWYWPCVQYMYYPSYVVWVSPWYWGYYPWYWDPWMPYPYYTYYGWTYMYYDYYYCCTPQYVLTTAHDVYAPRRVVSPTVQTRYATAHENHRDAVKKNPARAPGNVNPRPAEGDQKRTPPAPQQRGGSNPPPTPAPQPQPRPDVYPQPQPSPQPQPRPRVDPQPRPSPQPSPRPMPSPRPAPTPRPR